MKYFFSLFFIIFLLGSETLFAQAAGDSITDTYTIPDNETDSSADFVESNSTNRDSLLMPVPDSDYLFHDSIREVSQSQVKSYQLNPDYAYANDPDYWKKQPAQKPGSTLHFFSGPVFRWIIISIVISLVLFGIVQLVRENNFALFSRDTKKIKPESRDILQDETIDFESAIRMYQEEENYRLAIRFMYLRLIYTAREKTGIIIRDSSTNAEITRAFGSHPQAGEFRLLASAYEYIFYGGFVPRQELYEILKNKFESFQNAITI